MTTHATPVPRTRTDLARSWRSFLAGDRAGAGPAWLRLLWACLFSAALAVGFTVAGFAAFAHGDGAWRNLSGWVYWYGKNLVVSLTIGLTIHLFFEGSLSVLGVERVRALAGWRRTAYFMLVPMAGTAVGWPLGAEISGYELIGWQLWMQPNALAASILVALGITFVLQLLFNARSNQLKAERRAAEAQLRLLQGQMEPHFLFNTLANVLSLMEHDPPRARLMLEGFTDYLRSSLGSLRHQDATLGSELDLARAYLGLMKMRMEDRLRVDIDEDPALRSVPLPALLLQPLIENAIHHGLEAKLEGGSVCIAARTEGRALVLEVRDDGLGLAAPPRRRGAGMALANLRERLQVRYGAAASLSLAAGSPGTVATLRLPLPETPTHLARS